MSFHDPNFAKSLRSGQSNRRNNNDLIRSYTPLVRKLAWQVFRHSSKMIEMEDLMQIGMLSLTEAAYGYEDRGFGFANYAKLRVRGAMIDEIRKLSNLSRSGMEFQKELSAVRDNLLQQTGENPDEPALAHAMDMDQGSFRCARDQSITVDLKSMDEVYTDQNSCFQDSAEFQDEVLERKQSDNILLRAIDMLEPRDGMIIRMYFIDHMNLDEIGKKVGLGAARICQIKKAALEKLRENMGFSKSL